MAAAVIVDFPSQNNTAEGFQFGSNAHQISENPSSDEVKTGATGRQERQRKEADTTASAETPANVDWGYDILVSRPPEDTPTDRDDMSSSEHPTRDEMEAHLRAVSAENNAHFSGLSARIDVLASRVEGAVNGVGTRMDALASRMDAQFEVVKSKVDSEIGTVRSEISDVRTRLDAQAVATSHLPTTHTLITTTISGVLAVGALLVGILTWGGDRFSGGVQVASVSVQQATEARELATQNTRNIAQNTRNIEELNAMMRQFLASQAPSTGGAPQPGAND